MLFVRAYRSDTLYIDAIYINHKYAHSKNKYAIWIMCKWIYLECVTKRKI